MIDFPCGGRLKVVCLCVLEIKKARNVLYARERCAIMRGISKIAGVMNWIKRLFPIIDDLPQFRYPLDI